MIQILVLIVIAIIVMYLIHRNFKRKSKWHKPTEDFPTSWRSILTQYVSFYNQLSEEEKVRFEYKIQEFLLNCRITGIKTEVETIDKVLVASSAVIPIFGFKSWRYLNLHEVLLYPATFNQNFDLTGSSRYIAGMVGSGYMEGKMILSKPALRHGFKNEFNNSNTAIHEFVHLIDKLDGSVDGVPMHLLEKQYAIPWMDLMNKKIAEIYENRSDINPYGGKNSGEFFAVTSEYFFKNPELLAENHPELYGFLEQIFNQDMASRSSNSGIIEDKDPCPCGSGQEFKDCCGEEQYY